MKERLLILGIGGHGKVVADVAKKMGAWSEIAFLDDRYGEYDGDLPFGYGLVGKSKSVLDFSEDSDIFIAYGDNRNREKMQDYLESKGVALATLIHPSARVADMVTIGDGSVLMAGVVINSYTEIGRGCIINTSSTVDHDSLIADYVHISPGANLAGTVIVGERSWLGIGSIVSNNTSIAKDVTVGAGGVVIKDIYESGVYVGVPVFKLRDTE